jgi:hypothetical protein
VGAVVSRLFFAVGIPVDVRGGLREGQAPKIDLLLSLFATRWHSVFVVIAIYVLFFRLNCCLPMQSVLFNIPLLAIGMLVKEASVWVVVVVVVLVVGIVFLLR